MPATCEAPPAQASSIQVLHRVQNIPAKIILQTPRRSHVQPLLRELHWLPVQHRIKYKVTVLTFKSRSTDIPESSHQGSRQWTDTSLVWGPITDKPFTRTDFASRAFRCSAPTVWNSLPETIISADSLSVVKSRLKTYSSVRLLINIHDWPAASASVATALGTS